MSLFLENVIFVELYLQNAMLLSTAIEFMSYELCNLSNCVITILLDPQSTVLIISKSSNYRIKVFLNTRINRRELHIFTVCSLPLMPSQ
jgi:hypothetical protein